MRHGPLVRLQLVGRDHVRVRTVASDVNLPDFTSRAISRRASRAPTRASTTSRARGLRGPWIGAGVEHWKNRIGHPAEPGKGEYTNWMFTVGGGWVFNLGRRVYLNPWAAGHVRMSGDEQAQVGSRIYEPPKGLAETSIKPGLRS